MTKKEAVKIISKWLVENGSKMDPDVYVAIRMGQEELKRVAYPKNSRPYPNWL